MAFKDKIWEALGTVSDCFRLFLTDADFAHKTVRSGSDGFKRIWGARHLNHLVGDVQDCQLPLSHSVLHVLIQLGGVMGMLCFITCGIFQLHPRAWAYVYLINK